MALPRRRIHSGLILASGLLGLSLSVLILGASRGQGTDAGLPGSAAAAFTLKDATGTSVDVGRDRTKPVVLIIAQATGRNFMQSAREVRQIHETFTRDAAVRVIGVQVLADTGLLDAATPAAAPLRSACPELNTLIDPDGSIARAYRVTDTATAFVIDDRGVLRGRFPLDHDGAAVSVAETVSSIRPAKTSYPGITLPN